MCDGSRLVLPIPLRNVRSTLARNPSRTTLIPLLTRAACWGNMPHHFPVLFTRTAAETAMGQAPPKVALVHDWLTGMRGGEKCLELVCRAYPQAELFTLLHLRGRTSPDIERMKITPSFLQRMPGIAKHYRWYLPLMPRAIEQLQIPDDVDVVVSFSHAVAKSIRVPPGVPHLCYCFTPMRYAWQLREEYFGPREPQSAWQRVWQKTAGRVAAAARDKMLDHLRDWDRRTSSRVTKFIAISRTIEERIQNCYQRDSTVIFPPVDTQFYTPADIPREDFYLVVSALVPYKRIELAVAACNRLQKRLVVIGHGPELARLSSLAGSTVHLAGWRSNDEIRDHLRRCRALIFPGLEDFGIAPVEAQACGAPVIALGQGGVTETVLPAGNRCAGSGVFFEEPTVDALITAMDWFERHADSFDPDLAVQQARKFSTLRFTHQLLGEIEQAGGTAASKMAA